MIEHEFQRKLRVLLYGEAFEMNGEFIDPSRISGPVQVSFPPGFVPPPVVVNGETLAEWEGKTE